MYVKLCKALEMCFGEQDVEDTYPKNPDEYMKN